MFDIYDGSVRTILLLGEGARVRILPGLYSFFLPGRSWCCFAFAVLFASDLVFRGFDPEWGLDLA